MVDILQKVGIKSSSQNDVYKALTTVDGLSAWWTTDTQGESKVGGVLKFRFGNGGFDMKAGKHVLWRVVDGTGPSSSSITKLGRSRWNLCTTAAPSGECFC
jgi:uncharacterized protein YndB with AHSA1/START domain